MEDVGLTRTIEVERFDNGFSIRDHDSAEFWVIEESKLDDKHNKMKQNLGQLLFKDLDELFKVGCYSLTVNLQIIDTFDLNKNNTEK